MRISLKTFQTIEEFDLWVSRRSAKIQAEPDNEFITPILVKGQPVIIEDLGVLRITSSFDLNRFPNWEYLEFKVNKETVQYVPDGTDIEYVTGTMVLFHSGTVLNLPTVANRPINIGDELTILCLPSGVSEEKATIVGPFIYKGSTLDQIINVLEYQSYEFIHEGWVKDKDPTTTNNQELNWICTKFPTPDQVGDNPLLNIAPYDTYVHSDNSPVKERTITHNLNSRNIQTSITTFREGKRILGEQVYIEVINENQIKVTTTDEVQLEATIVSNFLTNPINRTKLEELLNVSTVAIPGSIPLSNENGELDPSWVLQLEGKLGNRVDFTEPGSYTFNFPKNVTFAIIIVIGAGGGSGCAYIDPVSGSILMGFGNSGEASVITIGETSIKCNGGEGGGNISKFDGNLFGRKPTITGDNVVVLESKQYDYGLIGLQPYDDSTAGKKGRRGQPVYMDGINPGHDTVITGGDGATATCLVTGSLVAANITVGRAGVSGYEKDNFAQNISAEFYSECDTIYNNPTNGLVSIIY